MKDSGRATEAPNLHLLKPGFHITVAAIALVVFGRTALGAFYVDCAACHHVSASGMNIVSYQGVTNLGRGQFKVLRITAGQTAAIQWSVTNGYGAKYALNINQLAGGGLNDTNHHLVYTPDPTWTNYFPGTSTNFFLAGPSAKAPHVWTFNLRIQTNTPSDYYFLRTQIAGYDSNHRKWSQPEDFYLQVMAPEALPLNRR